MRKSRFTPRRWLTASLLATFTAALLAPVAQADAGRRWKDGPAVRRTTTSGSTYIVRRSSAGPVIAGFLGGLFLGATIANAAPAGYDYYDPYCHRSYGSLELYYSHLRHCHHPRAVRVVAVVEGGPGRSRHGYGYRRDDCEQGYGGRRTWEREQGFSRYGGDDRGDASCGRGDDFCDRDLRDRGWDDDWDGARLRSRDGDWQGQDEDPGSSAGRSGV